MMSLTRHDADDRSELVYEELVRRMTVVYVSYSLRMEGEAVKESVVCGHHIHKELWR